MYLKHYCNMNIYILLCSGMMGGGGGGRHATTKGSGTGGMPLWPPALPEGGLEGEESEESRLRGRKGSSSSLPEPYFTLLVSPGSGTTSPGKSTTYTITVESHNGFRNLVSLSISGLPRGCNGSFSPPYGVTPRPSRSAILTLKVTTLPNAPATPVGGSSFNIYGRSGRTRSRASVVIVVK